MNQKLKKVKYMEREKVINEYLEYLKFQKNYSDYTVLNYKNDILEFFDYLSRENLNYKTIEYSDIYNRSKFLLTDDVYVTISGTKSGDMKITTSSEDVTIQSMYYKEFY